MGRSQGCAAMMSWGAGRRREKLLAIVFDALERCSCWLLSETKQGELERKAQFVREMRVEQSAAGTKAEQSASWGLRRAAFCWVDLSCWSSFDRVIGGFVSEMWGLVRIVAVGNISEVDRSE